MNYTTLFASLGAALALGAAATTASAAPATNLGGVGAAAGAQPLQVVRYDYDGGRRSWSYRSRWDNDDHRGNRRWWWHRRHHRDHDRDRWSWDRDRDDRGGRHHR